MTTSDGSSRTAADRLRSIADTADTRREAEDDALKREWQEIVVRMRRYCLNHAETAASVGMRSTEVGLFEGDFGLPEEFGDPHAWIESRLTSQLRDEDGLTVKMAVEPGDGFNRRLLRLSLSW